MKPEKNTPSASTRELAALYEVTDRTVRAWKAAGVNVSDPEAVAAHRATSQRPPGMSDLKEEKLKAETALKRAQAERAELLLEQTKGNLIPLPELEEALLFIATKVRSQLARLESELPPKLEGLDAKAMQRIIKDSLDATLDFLAAEFDSAAGNSEATEIS